MMEPVSPENNQASFNRFSCGNVTRYRNGPCNEKSSVGRQHRPSQPKPSIRIPWVTLGSRDSPRSNRAKVVRHFVDELLGLEAECVGQDCRLRTFPRVILAASFVWLVAMQYINAEINFVAFVIFCGQLYSENLCDF